ncbi:19072_t:CDS:1, partial [Gigaspora rosea]
MLFGGDLGQLSAVIMYATDFWSHDHISEAGHKVYSQINKAFKLETIQRQAGDSKNRKYLITSNCLIIG